MSMSTRTARPAASLAPKVAVVKFEPIFNSLKHTVVLACGHTQVRYRSQGEPKTMRCEQCFAVKA